VAHLGAAGSPAAASSKGLVGLFHWAIIGKRAARRA
jgi:hypothetical protein